MNRRQVISRLGFALLLPEALRARTLRRDPVVLQRATPFVVGPPAFYIRQRVAVTGGAASQTTAAITTVSGSCLVALFYSYASSTTTLTDSKGNTWQTAIAPFGSGTFGGAKVVPSCIGGAGHTFTLVVSGGSDVGLVVYEIVGAHLTTPVSSVNSNASSATSRTCGPLTAGATQEIFLALGSVVWGAEGAPVHADFTWAWDGASRSVDGYAVGNKTVEAGVTDAMAFTVSGANPEMNLIVGIKPATVAAPACASGGMLPYTG